jgi:branched-chain amino acid aminotransferase
MNFIIHNSELKAESVVLTTNNRAFRYGDGLFESIWYSEGLIPFLHQHLARLTRGMKLLGYKNCDCLNEESVRQMIVSLCQKNEIISSARIRLSVYRKEGGLYAPETDEFDFLMEASPLANTDFQLSSKGLIIGIAKSIFKPISPLTEIKTSNALIQVIAAREAKNKKWNDAVLLNERGRISEATSSNLFIVKGETIFTPPIEDGAMNGIMRQQISLLVKESDYKLRVKSLTEEDLKTADEIFLTNAIRGIIWVVGYDKRRFFNVAAKQLNQLLNNHIRELKKAKTSS